MSTSFFSKQYIFNNCYSIIMIIISYFEMPKSGGWRIDARRAWKIEPKIHCHEHHGNVYEKHTLIATNIALVVASSNNKQRIRMINAMAIVIGAIFNLGRSIQSLFLSRYKTHILYFCYQFLTQARMKLVKALSLANGWAKCRTYQHTQISQAQTRNKHTYNSKCNAATEATRSYFLFLRPERQLYWRTYAICAIHILFQVFFCQH